MIPIVTGSPLWGLDTLVLTQTWGGFRWKQPQAVPGRRAAAVGARLLPPITTPKVRYLPVFVKWSTDLPFRTHMDS